MTTRVTTSKILAEVETLRNLRDQVTALRKSCEHSIGFDPEESFRAIQRELDTALKGLHEHLGRVYASERRVK